MSSVPESSGGVPADVTVLQRVLAVSEARAAAAEARADELVTVVEGLLVRITELEAALRKDSKNSSKPPSQDGLGKRKRARPACGGSGRRPGGQPGHEGHSLERRIPDEVVWAGPSECGGCRADLSGVDLRGTAAEAAGSVQMLDVPPVRLHCIEYRAMKVTCPACAQVTAGVLPDGVNGPVCYGPNVKAATVLLAVRGHMSVARAAQMMHALLDTEVSTGFTSSLTRRLAKQLAPFMEELTERLRAASVLHVDETTATVSGDEVRFLEREALLRGESLEATRVEAAPGWMYVHTATTPDGLVFLGAHKRRSHAATDSFTILGRHRGVLVSDRLALYDKYTQAAGSPQICCAHLLRDLTGVIESEPNTDHAWAKAAQDVLRDAHTAVEHAKAAGRTRLAEDIAADLKKRYKHAYLVGLAQNTGRRTSQGKRHPAWVMAETLRKRADEIWLFTRRFDVPWTNNAAERALRMVKLQMAVSGCWRRVETADWYCTVRSYLDTARNHGINLIDALRDAFTGNPWMPPQQA